MEIYMGRTHRHRSSWVPLVWLVVHPVLLQEMEGVGEGRVWLVLCLVAAAVVVEA